MHRRIVIAAIVAGLLAGTACTAFRPPAPLATSPAPATRILVFTRTTGFRHDAIPVGVATVRELAAESGLQVEHSEDPSLFSEDTLPGYRAVIFLNTTGDVLDAGQQAAFERFVERGGGYLGIHAAADTEYDWPWYGALVGAWFEGHPPGLQTTHVRFEHAHDGLPGPWRITDELYNYKRNPRADVTVLATVDESGYAGGSMGSDHPIAWCHERLGGRAWYTGLGHDANVYAQPFYRAHLLRGLRWVSGLGERC